MSDATTPGSEPSTGGLKIKEVIERLIRDPEFKKWLIENPDEALKEYELSEVQKMLIKTLEVNDLDKLTPENLEELFSADAAVYTPDQGSAPDDFDTFDEDDELK